MGYGFWVMGYGFWVLGSGFWVLGSGFWVLGSRRDDIDSRSLMISSTTQHLPEQPHKDLMGDASLWISEAA